MRKLDNSTDDERKGNPKAGRSVFSPPSRQNNPTPRKDKLPVIRKGMKCPNCGYKTVTHKRGTVCLNILCEWASWKKRCPKCRGDGYISSFTNRWKTFKTIEVEEYSDEWFRNEMWKRNPRGTICETHRYIFHAVNTLPGFQGKDRILDAIKKAYIQGQKMSDRLKELKEMDYADG